jgi:hypothetical protein
METAVHVPPAPLLQCVRQPSQSRKVDGLACESHPRSCIQRVPPLPQAGSSPPRLPARHQTLLPDPQTPANLSHLKSNEQEPALPLASLRRLFAQGQRQRQRSRWPMHGSQGLRERGPSLHPMDSHSWEWPPQPISIVLLPQLVGSFCVSVYRTIMS